MIAKISGYDGKTLSVEPEKDLSKMLLRTGSQQVELRIIDGRVITPEQRKKIFATIRDISDWCGHSPEEVRQILTWDFRSIDGRGDFSLSNVEQDTATDFISYLIDFCLRWDVPTKEPLSKRAEDIDRYLYQCLEERKCAVCGRRADIHHVDTVGMGRNRKHIVHTGLAAIALCRQHHQECHTIGADFFRKYHIYGVPLTEQLLQKLALTNKKIANTK